VSKQFWIFGGVGVAAIAVLLFLVLEGNKGAHLDLEGKVLKVRTMPVNAKAALLLVDFRVTNTADIPYMVKAITITVTPAAGDAQEGTPVPKQDLQNVFEQQKLLIQFNPILITRDKLPPHSPVDRVAAARFEMPESDLDNRRDLKIRIDEVDGVSVEFAEKKQ
jgi:hypothetical protein